VILLWIAFVVGSLAVGGAVGTRQLDAGGTGSSAKADRVLADKFPRPVEEDVLVGK
jgi:hypothetical protein